MVSGIFPYPHPAMTARSGKLLFDRQLDPAALFLFSQGVRLVFPDHHGKQWNF